MSPPPFWTRIYLRRDPALSRCRWETSARKPYGCIYSLRTGCHTFGNNRLRPPCIGFVITETPSIGVSSVAAWSRVPRRTICPPLCGYACCWLEVPSTTIDQIVLPETLRPRVIDLAHYSKLAGHLGQTRMYHHVRSTYYWPQMAADIYRTVRTCNACARNRVNLRKRMHPLRLFPAQRPLESLSISSDRSRKRRKATGFCSLLRTALRNLRKLSR